ncbi:MAG: spore germination protein [Firmicutes bacterium]|nr:spore germination protein [Bacillota bacterium]
MTKDGDEMEKKRKEKEGKKYMENIDHRIFGMYMEILKEQLPVGESFDLLERKLMIGGRRASMFFVDGLTDGEKTQRILAYLMALPAASLCGVSSSHRFIETALPFLDANVIEPKSGNAGGNPDSGESSGASDQTAAGQSDADQAAASDGGRGFRPEPWEAAAPHPAAQGGAGCGSSTAVMLSRVQAEDCCRQMLPKLYAGLVPLLVEGLDRIIIIDCRDYPSRSVEEPDKERTLRGAKDGFTENFMENVALIRRRLRDNNLIFKAYNVGSVSKADVAVVYMKNKADMNLIKKLDSCLKEMEPCAEDGDSDEKEPAESKGIHSEDRASRRDKVQKAARRGGREILSMADQSLLERLLAALGAANGLNPFPKVRYTQRPDIIAAHLAEGKAAIIVDNSPTVMLLPASVFDFFQDMDDYYFPRLTGNYLRLIRIINFFVILFLTPVYFLLVEYREFAPEMLQFFVPAEDFAIPIFWQFILLEIAVDGLKLASLNTPTSLGMSLSVIGALILGEFSIDSGWFITQTILCMAVVALAAFTQTSIELSYAMKFGRILMLVGAQLLGLLGSIAALVIYLVVMASTKTISGKSYLYPLIPFNGAALKRLIFRTRS